MLALLAALQLAMKTGRLLLVDWHRPHGGWKTGLALPTTPDGAVWDWDWPSFRCAGHDGLDVTRVSGSVSVGHPALEDVVAFAAEWHDRALPHAHNPDPAHMEAEFGNFLPRRFALAPHVLRPSAVVLQALGPLYVQLNATYVVGLQVRTGRGAVEEHMPFLSPGDEHSFFDCYRAFAKTEQLDPAQHRVLVVSDNPAVLAAARAELGSEADVVVRDDAPIGHTYRHHTPRDAFVNAFADLFALSRADVFFVTAWSLFGQAAAEIGVGGNEHVVHDVSDSKCGSSGHKRCRQTPRVCTVARDEL